MSQSHNGVFPPRQKRHAAAPASLMTQSNYGNTTGLPASNVVLPQPKIAKHRNSCLASKSISARHAAFLYFRLVSNEDAAHFVLFLKYVLSSSVMLYFCRFFINFRYYFFRCLRLFQTA